MLFNYLGCQRIDIVDLYFSVYERRISSNGFISLICTFTFFTLEQILQVLLSICGIHSNCYINQEQIFTFLSSLNVEIVSMKLTEKWLATRGESRHSKKPKRVSLKSFLKFLLDNPTVINTLFYFKACLIERIITDHTYKIIIERKNYYNSLVDDKYSNNINNNYGGSNSQSGSHVRINLHKSSSRIRNYNSGFINYSISNNRKREIPPEPICRKIFRIIFTNEPPPYYSEYVPLSYINSNNNSFDTIIYLLRCKYGYSKRLTAAVTNSLRNTTTNTNTESTNSEDFVVKNRTKHSLNSRKSGLFKSPNYTPRSLIHASKDENITSPKTTLISLPGAVNNHLSLSSSQIVRKGMSVKTSTYSKTIQDNTSQIGV